MKIENRKTLIKPIFQTFRDYINKNCLCLMRDDLIPFSFGGNKVRKALLFSEEIDAGRFDYIVTYGSSTSNHCRVIANLAAQKNLPCLIISPNEKSKASFNRQLVESFGAEIETCDVSEVKATIDTILQRLRDNGYTPYFIPGGGHGNIGSEAYVLAYKEIRQYEVTHDIFFDYIFLASGTGTTQAGLICGKLLSNDINRKIVGISIARNNPKATEVIRDSILEYLGGEDSNMIEESLLCVDDYVCDGYGKYNQEISNLILDIQRKYGIPLDPFYTGKAFWGMLEYCKGNQIQDKNILFIHTGGTPLFFDFLKGQYEKQ